MKESYPLNKLYWQSFEDLVIDICQNELGTGTIKFEEGEDGGRDASFEGTANRFPSEKDCWNGKFIIQAKHTSDITLSCSDIDFRANKDYGIISKEIEKLKLIKKNDGLDNYILFTNRKLPANTYAELKKRIKDEVGVSNVEIIGRQNIFKYLSRLPNIVKKYSLSEISYPIRFYEKDIQKIIEVFDSNINSISNVAGNSVSKYDHLDKEGEGNKNDINSLGAEYFEFMSENSLSSFYRIEAFLADIKNEKFRKKYEATTSDLKAKIILERKKFGAFEEVIEDLVDFIDDKCGEELDGSRSLIRVFIHFMYFECDIGKKSKDE